MDRRVTPAGPGNADPARRSGLHGQRLDPHPPSGLRPPAEHAGHDRRDAARARYLIWNEPRSSNGIERRNGRSVPTVPVMRYSIGCAESLSRGRILRIAVARFVVTVMSNSISPCAGTVNALALW